MSSTERILIRLTLLLSIFYCSGCLFSYQRLEFKRGVSALNRGDYDEGLALLERVIKRDPNAPIALSAARRGAKAAVVDSKDYKRGLFFNKQLVLYSPESTERILAQKQIALIQFESLANYEQAIEEYNKLLTLPHGPDEAYQYQLNIAKSYYQLNNFYQAGVEVDELLARPLNADQKFDVQLFKANLLLTGKKLDEAAKVFSDILIKYPERAKKENVALNLSVCYEEKGDLNKAIQVLQNLRASYPTPEFIDLKIKKLQERAQNLPGAEGLKK